MNCREIHEGFDRSRGTKCKGCSWHTISVSESGRKTAPILDERASKDTTIQSQKLAGSTHDMQKMEALFSTGRKSHCAEITHRIVLDVNENTGQGTALTASLP